MKRHQAVPEGQKNQSTRAAWLGKLRRRQGSQDSFVSSTSDRPARPLNERTVFPSLASLGESEDSLPYLERRNFSPFQGEFQPPREMSRRPSESTINSTGTVNSPSAFSEISVRSPDAMTTSRPSTPSRRMFDRAPAPSPPPSRSATPIQSATKHWNHIRNAIKTGGLANEGNSSPVRATTPVSSAGPSGLPPRSQTPKPSRLARLGFRQAVENLRAQVSESEEQFNRFALDVHQACLHARTGESRPKVEREGTQASAYLGFMSSTSLVGGPFHAKSGTSNELPKEKPPSLDELHRVLVRHASTGDMEGNWRLPHEAEVLSVLLIPYLVDSRRDMEEQWLAIETFELAVQTWNATNKLCEVDRLLWCCKAALIPPSPVRSRVLGMLSNMVFSSKPLQDTTPLAIQTFFQALQLVAHAIDTQPSEGEGDMDVVRELCNHVYNGGCGDPTSETIPQEYGIELSFRDTPDFVRTQILAEAAVRCLQNGSEELKRWTLHNVVGMYWSSSTDVSPLSGTITLRKITSFLRSSLSLIHWDISQSKPSILESDANVFLQLIKNNVLADMKDLTSSAALQDCRSLLIQLILELLETTSAFITQQVIILLDNWFHDDTQWISNWETAIKTLVAKLDWSILARIVLNVITKLPSEFQRKIVPVAVSGLHARLALEPGPATCLPLSLLFDKLAELYPQQFYMPLFALASAAKEPTLIGQLSVVIVLARHLPSFWIRDAEMISIAVLSDASKSKAKATGDADSPWARLRIGQSLILVELIRCIRKLSETKKDPNAVPDKTHPQAYKFFVGIEARMAALLEAKESERLVPLSQRVLISTLFLEIRLFTRSLKPAPWLSTLVRWASESYNCAPLSFVSRETNPFASESPFTLGDEDQHEVALSMQRARSLYDACQTVTAPSGRQRSTLAVSSIVDALPSAGIIETFGFVNEAVNERQVLLNALPNDVSIATLRALVAISALLSHSAYKSLGPVLWSHLLDGSDFEVLNPACFLLTHCLERSPDHVAPRMKSDLLSSESNVRRKVVLRMMTLFAFRSELLGQSYVSDRNHRRPFKLARHPIPFVAIDAGSGVYIHEQTEEDRKKLAGGGFSADIRRRLAEAGWNEDEGPTDTKLEKIRAPMSLFSLSYLDQFNGINIAPSAQTSDHKQLLRRKSSGTNQTSTHKRRSVFVPALASLFPLLAFAATDSDPNVAGFAREALLIMLRDDPNMLCRPIFEAMPGDMFRIGETMSTISAFLHIHHRLPPSASHHLFANIAGFLKHISRETDDSNALKAFSCAVPLLEKLITQVSNLNMRDLRRAKFEIFVFPSGSLWFPPTAPASSMFPRSLQAPSHRRNEIPDQLAFMCMIRTGQNMLLLNMLKFKPQEVQAVRKTLANFVLPGDNTGKKLDAWSFLPRYSLLKSPGSFSYEQVSLALSRSHLLLLQQVFKSMPRNSSNKQELARLFDGLNRITLVHGTDLGIVAHALIACMVGATRFKRFFTSGGGFSLFMPTFIKVYAENEGNVGIRLAIQYASSRFYAIHEEAYLFQSLELASETLTRLDNMGDRELFAQAIWDLFSSLKVAIRPGAPDPAGIHGSNKQEEKELLIEQSLMADEEFNTNTQARQSERLKKLSEIEEYEAKVLHLDNFARLFVTIIAHNPAIMRAQNFLTLFRLMTSGFYNGSKSARDVLREGTNALGLALFPKSSLNKLSEADHGRSGRDEGLEGSNSPDAGETSLFPCDQVTMAREYLRLVVAFIRMGGDLRHSTVKQALELVKSLLKDSNREEPEFEGAILHELLSAHFSRLGITPKQVISLLQEVAPVLRTFALSVDCSKAIDAIRGILAHSELSKLPELACFIAEEIANPLIAACSQAALDNLLMSLPIRHSVIALSGQLASLERTDVAGGIEQQAPSPGFLCGVVLPLCMAIRTSAEIASQNQFQTTQRARRHGLIFARLLGYSMHACETNMLEEARSSSPLPGVHRRGSARKSSLNGDRISLATLAIAVQIIKTVAITAADDVSVSFNGIWVRVARFLRKVLRDGDAQFALPPPVSPLPSPLPSPWHSPRLTPTSHDPFLQPSTPSQSSKQPPLHDSKAMPRVVDYLTWSFMEFLCCQPSPLNVQMRLWMQEKVSVLDSELKAREGIPRSSRKSRRLSSSIFAKPRGSSISPDTLRASGGLSRTPSDLNLSASFTSDVGTHNSAYNRFPSPISSSSSPQAPWNGPRIVHLGPAKLQPPPFESALLDSPLKTLVRSSNIALPALIRMTRDRIRVVQTCLGYDRLLPTTGSNDETLDVKLTAWTKNSALTMVINETKLIIEEFPECFREIVGGGFVDVPSTPEPASPGRRPILF